MPMNINYLTDSTGKKVAVQIPIRVWSKFIEVHKRLEQYYNMKTNLEKSFDEIDQIEKGKKTASTLSEFLDEC